MELLTSKERFQEDVARNKARAVPKTIFGSTEAIRTGPSQWFSKNGRV